MCHERIGGFEVMPDDDTLTLFGFPVVVNPKLKPGTVMFGAPPDLRDPQRGTAHRTEPNAIRFDCTGCRFHVWAQVSEATSVRVECFRCPAIMIVTRHSTPFPESWLAE
jgi:hypothetical protein